jgi:uracil-DNA glycosylase
VAVAARSRKHTLGRVIGTTERRERLKAVYDEARQCTACSLHQTRTTVVFGAGNADADLMFIGEAPGANEDKLGLPFVGAAGKLLDKLLAEIGLDRSEVFIANTVKCRPPGNRDPHPHEIESCHRFLRAQVELVAPRVICSLGNFATKLLRGDPTGITRLHGRPEIIVIGSRAIRLLPLLHPAAALYNPGQLETVREDVARLPALLALPAPPQPGEAPVADEAQPTAPKSSAPPPESSSVEPEPRSQVEVEASPPRPADEPQAQLNLF